MRFPPLSRQVIDSSGRVIRNAAILHRDVQHGCEHAVGPDDHRLTLWSGAPLAVFGRDLVGRSSPCRPQLRHPRLYIAVCDGGDGCGSPPRFDVHAPRVVECLVAGGLQSRALGREPVRSEFRDRDAGSSRVYVLPRRLGHFDCGEEEVGLAFRALRFFFSRSVLVCEPVSRVICVRCEPFLVVRVDDRRSRGNGNSDDLVTRLGLAPLLRGHAHALRVIRPRQTTRYAGTTRPQFRDRGLASDSSIASVKLRWG